MAKVTVERQVNASQADTWAAWDDFGNIQDFNPSLRRSALLEGSQPTGLGAERRCDMKDGKNHILERVVGYVPGRELVIDIYDGTMPLKAARATVTVTPDGAARSIVHMEMEFTPGLGLLGTAMIPLMKIQFRKMLNGLLAGNAEFVERRAA